MLHQSLLLCYSLTYNTKKSYRITEHLQLFLFYIKCQKKRSSRDGDLYRKEEDLYKRRLYIIKQYLCHSLIKHNLSKTLANLIPSKSIPLQDLVIICPHFTFFDINLQHTNIFLHRFREGMLGMFPRGSPRLK